MPLILLGLLVAAGLIAYMYFSGQSGTSEKSKSEESESREKSDSSSVIYLPDDIEGEKQKRNVKTGK